MSIPLSPRIGRWRDAWQGRSPEAVGALYLDDARHESLKVKAAMPEMGRAWLQGPREMEALKRRALERIGDMYFEVVNTLEDKHASVVEYLARSDRRPEPERVVEWIDWSPDGRIAASRVYHF